MNAVDSDVLLCYVITLLSVSESLRKVTGDLCSRSLAEFTDMSSPGSPPQSTAASILLRVLVEHRHEFRQNIPGACPI